MPPRRVSTAVNRLSRAEKRLSIALKRVLQVANLSGQRQNACTEQLETEFFLTHLPDLSRSCATH